MIDSTPRIQFSLSGLAILVMGFALGLAFSKMTSNLRPRIAPSEAYAFDLPEYLIEPPDMVAIRASPLVDGEFIVGPDGKVNLGKHGTIYLAGRSVQESKAQVASILGAKNVAMRVVQFNSKVFYLVVEVNGNDELFRLPYTGADTVLAALANYRRGDISKQNIWIARMGTTSKNAEILPVSFEAITRNADASQNYQLLPGDRLFVSSKTMPAQTR